MFSPGDAIAPLLVPSAEHKPYCSGAIKHPYNMCLCILDGTRKLPLPTVPSLYALEPTIARFCFTKSIGVAPLSS